jgi:hypothetical protein
MTEPAPSHSADLAAWPSIGEAYTFVVPSYTWLLSRLEAADNRLTALLTVLTTLTLGVPVFARAVRPDIAFRAPEPHRDQP